MKKILFCIPWYIDFDSVKKSLNRLEKYRTGKKHYTIGDDHITIQHIQSPYISMARNSFITGKLKIHLYKPEIRDFDEWIFCDSDIEFTEKDMLGAPGSWVTMTPFT